MDHSDSRTKCPTVVETLEVIASEPACIWSRTKIFLKGYIAWLYKLVSVLAQDSLNLFLYHILSNTRIFILCHHFKLC